VNVNNTNEHTCVAAWPALMVGDLISSSSSHADSFNAYHINSHSHYQSVVEPGKGGELGNHAPLTLGHTTGHD